jgi:hypothetical protein
VRSASANSRARPPDASARSGRYRAVGEELEAEFIPAKDMRIELGGSFAAYDINGVPGFDDRRRLAWQGVSVDFR